MILAPNASAAETIILKYSVLEAPISVPELSTFVNTGELSPSLKAYLKLANRNPDELRQALTQRVNVDGVVLSQVLNSFAGEFLLDQLSEVVHTPSQRSSRQALRSALVTSALSDNDVRLIEVLENYPTSEVHVEGDRLADVYRQIDTVVGRLPKLPF
nr:alpha/beta hydrolase [Gloeothece citriformis]